MQRDSATMLVARNIEAAMHRKGSNPADLARRAGVNPTGVYDILSGKSRSPRVDTLQKIAVGLGVPVASLFSEPLVDRLDQDLLEAFGMLSEDNRQRFLLMVRALLAEPAPRA